MQKCVLIIGAGQMGLAAAYYLQQANIAFEIIDAEAKIGDNWRKRYSTLTLFTPRQYSALPGLPLLGDEQGYASRDEFADYLTHYAHSMNIPVRLKTPISSLTKQKDGSFLAQLPEESAVFSHVIVATGGFQRPLIPAMAEDFADTVQHFTPETIADGSTLPNKGNILIVGDGASGRDLALLANQKHPVLLATGKPRPLLPETLLGQSIWWWLKKLGLMQVSATSWIGKTMRKKDPFPNRQHDLTHLKAQGIRIMPRLKKAQADTAYFADQSQAIVTAVIWATGYQDDTDWLHIPNALNEQGQFIHRAGHSNIQHLYYLGKPWQRNRASALIMGASDDAKLIVQQIAQ